jgi:hypothetical protein
MLESLEKDPYVLRGKLPDPSACPSCGAVYRAGRWSWGSPPVDAHPAECPACRRIADDYPAGIVTLRGEFSRDHAAEIQGLVRNLEEHEKSEHPLKRIMSVRAEPDALVVTTTSARLARGIGEALQHAFRGELDYRFSEAESVLRVDWSR